MNGHTPGPWIIEPWYSNRDDRECLTVVTRLHNEDGSRDCRFIADLLPLADGDGCHDADTIANASLISAAPDLLAALEEIGAALSNWNRIISGKSNRSEIEEVISYNAPELIEAARAAIKKAMGEA